MSFLGPSALEAHVRTVHRKERPYSCTVCGKSFANKSGRNTHLRLHLNELPFKCVDCDRRFRQVSCLKKHMRRTHQAGRFSQCPQCPFVYGRETDMLKHYLREHKGSTEDFLQCVFCNESFKYLFRLEIHTAKHTRELPYWCKVCSKSFVLASRLKDHHQQVHGNDRLYKT